MKLTEEKSPLKIGPYKADATAKEAFCHADIYNMYATRTSSKTQGDSLAGNATMYFLYKDERYVFSAKKLWYFNSYGNYVGQRHPELPPEIHPMSRDHYHSTLSVLKMHYDETGSKASMMKIKEITDNTGYIISKMARRGFGLKCWSKAIQGKKGYQMMWHIIGIFQALILYRPVHFILGKIANFGEEVDQEDYKKGDAFQLQAQPEWKSTISKIMYPSFAMQMTGWKLFVLDGFSWLKKLHQKAYQPMIGKTNYVQQMLFGMKVPRDKVESYKAMQGGRWGGYLSSRNDRNMKVLDPQPEYNNIDVDVVRRLYNETQL